MSIATYLSGKCLACKRVFQWEAASGVRVRDAICLGCDGPLAHSRRKRLGVPVEHVDAEWVRRPGKPAVDPEDPTTWPSFGSTRDKTRRTKRRIQRRGLVLELAEAGHGGRGGA